MIGDEFGRGGWRVISIHNLEWGGGTSQELLNSAEFKNEK